MIDISNYKPNPNPNSAAAASFTVTVQKWGGFQIRNCILFRKDGKSWIGYPSREYEKDGKKAFFAFVGFNDREMADAFQDKIFDALKKMAPAEPQPDQMELPF